MAAVTGNRLALPSRHTLAPSLICSVFNKRLQTQSGRSRLYLAIALTLILVAHYQVVQQLPRIVSNDTLLHLSGWQIVFVLLLAIFGCAALSLLCLKKTHTLQRRLREKHRVLSTTNPVIVLISDLLVTAGLCWIALSTAPQMFYTLYRLIIPGLPAQWVVKTLYPQDLIGLLSITMDSTLAQLGTTVLLQSIFLATLLLWIDFWRRR